MSKTPITDTMRSVLSSPEKWAKGVLARDEYHAVIDPLNPYACSFCLSGAAHLTGNWTLAINLLKVAANTCSIPQWNDYPERTFDDVLKLLDRMEEIERGFNEVSV